MVRMDCRICSAAWPALLAVCLIALPAPAGTMQDPGPGHGELGELPRPQPTADHTTFEALQGRFATGPEVTRACLGCHTEAARQVMQTSHWTWICPRAKAELADRQNRVVGKGEHVINNFCIALGSNEPRCTSCHAGYGWRDETFDFNDQTRVDCLVCHDTTGTYRKFPTDAGHPVYETKEWPKGSGNLWEPPDLGRIARAVGKPTRHNCGVCHFFGGGGEGVKHGDMDVSLEHPDRSIDVHMASGDTDFRCTECHTTVNHQISGRCFTIPAYERRQFVMRGTRKNLLACESCHGAAPHDSRSKLNDHTDKVSCQACHIPYLAPEKPTKMWWDWSEAGKRDERGKPLVKHAAVTAENPRPDGEAEAPVDEHTYHGLKGEFIWARRAVPEYVWFNGRVSHTFIGDPLDDRTPGRETGSRSGRYDMIDLDRAVVRINAVHGGYDDRDSRIWPVKIHRGRQPYDPVNKTLVVPKLFPAGEDAGVAYWKTLEWGPAIEAGMAYVGQPYSGEYDFIQTEMVWPLSHMVTPKEQAVTCEQCHRRDDGRLAALGGFYMPGRDRSAVLDLLGWLAVAGAFLGVAVHGTLRITWRRKGDDQ